MRKGYRIILIILLIIFLIWVYITFYNVRPNKQQLLVLRNYNPQAGLHWMGIYNVIVAHNEAEKSNLKLVVLLDSGLYLEKQDKYLNQYREYIDPENNEWFSYYFEPIGIDDPEVNQLWKEGNLDHLPSYTKYDTRKNTIGYEFDRASLDAANGDLNYSEGFKEKIKLKPYLKNKVEEFYNRNMKGKFLIGIHVRGTDKFSSVDSHENHPKHFTYQQYCNAIEKEINFQKNYQCKPIAVLAVSDEQPFIDYIHNTLGRKYNIISDNNVLRSNISTSGVNIICDENNQDCEHFKNNSIHRGMPGQSNFKKGLDAVYEVYLLSKCDVFYKSRGNFSNAVTYINPRQKVVDMVSSFAL